MRCGQDLLLHGPIPAPAGQPQGCGGGGGLQRAYPRSRGATRSDSRKAATSEGLSPLPRGNRGILELFEGRAGPIPAPAGQPSAAGATGARPRAYPRSRGATRKRATVDCKAWGLSPLPRGNHQTLTSRRLRAGPIPAPAGQPGPRRTGARRRWAYPRSRGATQIGGAQAAKLYGLSPLPRGNRDQSHGFAHWNGPIPAPAGQPLSYARRRPCVGAYPRSRGATTPGRHHGCRMEGLSPLPRGNRNYGGCEYDLRGPIPAPAGQPADDPPARLRSRAYPRSRGATFAAIRYGIAVEGLSPLPRGNPTPVDADELGIGPIPAPAGQPQLAVRGTRASRAYPRSRGATWSGYNPWVQASGLSPLPRGNQRGTPYPVTP